MRKACLLFFIAIFWVGLCQSTPVEARTKHKKTRLQKPKIVFKVLGCKPYDMRNYYINIVVSSTPKGELVSSMVKRSKAVFGVNGGYFDPETLSSIGTIWCMGKDLTECTIPYRRGVLSQDTQVRIGLKAPNNSLFSIEAGPILIHDGEIVRSYQWFFPSFWNHKSRVRNVIATCGHNVLFYRFRGSLWDTAKYLKKKGILFAENLDGGSSCAKWKHVRNAIVVLPKTTLEYQNYKQQCSWLNNMQNNTPQSSILQ